MTNEELDRVLSGSGDALDQRAVAKEVMRLRAAHPAVEVLDELEAWLEQQQERHQFMPDEFPAAIEDASNKLRELRAAKGV